MGSIPHRIKEVVKRERTGQKIGHMKLYGGVAVYTLSCGHTITEKFSEKGYWTESRHCRTCHPITKVRVNARG